MGARPSVLTRSLAADARNRAAAVSRFFQSAREGDIAGLRDGLARLSGADAKNVERASEQWRRDGMSALMQATLTDQIEAVEFLIPYSDLENTLSRQGSAVHVAAEYGLDRCLRALLASGAHPSPPGRADGLTPLMLAAHNATLGHRACVETLLPLSDPNATDTQHRTALFFAAARQGSPEMVLLLAKRSALTFSRSENPQTNPFFAAIDADRPQCLSALIFCAPDAEALLRVRAGGESLLAFAVSKNRPDCVSALLPAFLSPSVDLETNSAFSSALLLARQLVNSGLATRALPRRLDVLLRLAEIQPLEIIEQTLSECAPPNSRLFSCKRARPSRVA